MTLTAFDWTIIAFFFAITIGIGALVSKKASQSSSAFFLANRNMPWWLLGTSMVATTFAADTPLLVTDIVRNHGVAGNWIWWSFLLTGTLTTFVFARLWRRSGVFTDLEFYELRYHGSSASALRAFRALYLGVFFNIMVMATVSLAAIKISAVVLGASPLQTVLIAGIATLIFSAMGGFIGVVLTDLILFLIAMIGAISAAWYTVQLPEVGGLHKLFSIPDVSNKLSMLPDFSNTEQAIMIFVIPLAVQWWNVWYPGAEPGGGGYVAQRMLAARDERHSMGAVLLFQVAHYALRPWPWILVALASLVVFPNLDAIRVAFPDVDPAVINHDLAYPAMLTLLPAGLAGLVIASMISAYISTMSTQINWGASYVVNDFYHRFVNPAASEKTLVLIGRITSVGLMVVASILSLFLESAIQAFQILLSIGAGTGLLFILRWFWWRINAWSEISAMVISFLAALFFHLADLQGWPDWLKIVAPIVITTISWVLVTLSTPATPLPTLAIFVEKINPSGPGWKTIKNKLQKSGQSAKTHAKQNNLPLSLLSVLVSSIGIYSLLFSIGYLLYGNLLAGMSLLLLSIMSAAIIARNWKHIATG